MIIHEFKYERPSSIEDALALLSEHGKGARPLAGGTDVVINMKYRSLLQLVDGAGSKDAKFEAAMRVPPIDRPKVLVSLRELDELCGVKVDATKTTIGPRTTMVGFIDEPALEGKPSAIKDAAMIMGSPLIRNRATIGGNLVNARPAADTLVAAIAEGAILKLKSSKGERDVAANEFVTAPGRTVKKPDELLVAIEVQNAKGQGSAYTRQGTRKQLEIPIVCVAAWLKLDSSKNVADARICLGAVGPTPLLAQKAAAVLVGSPPTPERLAEAAKTARSEAKPIDDFRAHADYRLDLVEVLTERTLKTALMRAESEVA